MFLVRSGAISGYEKLVKRLGGNPIALLEEAGISSAQVRNPNNYVSYSKVAELMELSALQLSEPCFGLLMAQYQNSSVLGDLNMTILQQATVRDALEAANRNLYLHARGARLQVESSGQSAYAFLTLEVKSSLGLSQLLQMSAGHVANFIRDLLQIPEPKFPIMLQQPEPDTRDSAVDRGLLSRVRFGSALDGIGFASSWLDSKPSFDQESLRVHLQEYLAMLQERYPENLSDQVKDIIGQLLATGECILNTIASTLDMQPRVLQLRLQEAGGNYGELLRETRLELAEQHLRHRSLSIMDLALKLGYSETSTFSRNFKQWTGYSPRQWQQHHLK